jgi:hypothetical protein
MTKCAGKKRDGKNEGTGRFHVSQARGILYDWKQESVSLAFSIFRAVGFCLRLNRVAIAFLVT